MRAIQNLEVHDNDKEVISRTVINAFSKRAFYTSSNSTLVLRFVSESYAPLITSRLMLKKGPSSCKDIEAARPSKRRLLMEKAALELWQLAIAAQDNSYGCDVVYHTIEGDEWPHK